MINIIYLERDDGDWDFAAAFNEAFVEDFLDMLKYLQDNKISHRTVDVESISDAVDVLTGTQVA